MQAPEQYFHQYNKQLQPFANTLRKEMTKAEASLWKYVLRAEMMKGYSFRRQRPVLDYIADFMCIPLKLIIEVDGTVHRDAQVAAKDQEKQVALEDAGFHVMRFKNEDVLQRLSEVRLRIEDWIDGYPYS